jgi:hypothetical protein
MPSLQVPSPPSFETFLFAHLAKEAQTKMQSGASIVLAGKRLSSLGLRDETTPWIFATVH